MTTLVIPDLHQDLPWTGRILAAEAGRFDRLVFLGDYFDAQRPASNAKQVARMLLGVEAEVGVPVTFLVGNHDYQYAMLEHVQHPPKETWAVTGGCSGYSASRADDINRVLRGSGFWSRCALATEAGGYLLSHAGVLPHLWPASVAYSGLDGRGQVQQVLGVLAHVWKDRFVSGLSPAFNGSRAWRRLGPFVSHLPGVNPDAPPAGLLWCDWHAEFEDALPLPQIVGHTGPDSGEPAARQKGRSWCLDGQQTTYAVIEGGSVGKPGTLHIKTA